MSTNNENLNIIKNGLDAASPSLLTTKNEENIDEGIFQPFDTNNKSENEETQIKNGTDLSPKKNIEELIDEIEEDSNLLNLSVSARMISLKMLLKSKILTPGKSVMTVEYLGQKFYGDLLEDGRIKSQETEAIFSSPSAWALNVKRIINPDKKSGVGWSSIKYKDKKLDVYKALYQKRCMEEKIKLDATCAQEEEELKNNAIKKEEEYIPPPKRALMQYSAINRSKEYDVNSPIEAVPFQSIGKIQPFIVSMSSSAVMVMDFHCHLTKNEVFGYFGGTFDHNTLSVHISHAFPCLNSRFDREKAQDCEENIQDAMEEQNCTLVGWYHSHPFFNVNPTIRDCDSQLDYQIVMGGTSLETHIPCIGMICSTYDEDIEEDEDKYLPFWVIPPSEGRLHDCPKPVTIQHTVKQDEKLTDNIKLIMEECVKYYKEFDKELIDFDQKVNENGKIRYADKFKQSLYPKFPKDEINNDSLWNWICELLDIEKEENVKIPDEAIRKVRKRHEEAEQIQNLFIVPKTPPQILEKDRLREQEKQRIKFEEEANRATLNAISCLQQQLSLPSGLNMTPSPISSSIVLPSTIKNNNSKNNNSSNNNNHHNISKSSNSGQSTNNSIGNKLEVSIRATPSPAKSDHSQKSRSSPAQNRNSQNSSRPSSTSSSSSKFDVGFPGATGINDLYAATLASLASKLPPGLLPTDYAALLKSMPDYGLSALGALTASAAAYGNSPNTGATNTKRSNTPSQSTTPSYLYGSSMKASPSTHGSHSSQQKQKQNVSSNNSRSSTNNSFNAASASWLNQIPNMKEFMAQLEKGDLSVLMQSPYNIPSCKPSSTSTSNKAEKNNSSAGNASSSRTNYNMPTTSDHSKRKSSKSSYDYDSYKSEAGKVADLMKSPEYTQMLLMQQAQAFRGLGSEITVTRKPASSTVTSQSAKKTSTSTSAAQSNQSSLTNSSILQHLPVMDLNSLAEMSKSIPELNALLNSNKPEDINALLQFQMMANTKSTPDYSSLFGNPKTNKAVQDYAAALAAVTTSNPNLLSQYMLGTTDLTSLFGPMSSLYGMGGLGLNMIPNSGVSSLTSNTYSQSNTHGNNKNNNYGQSNSTKKKESKSSSSPSQHHLTSHHSVSPSSKTTVAPNAAEMMNSLFAGSGTSSKTNTSHHASSLLKSHDLSNYLGGLGTSPLLNNSPSTSKAPSTLSGGGITSAFDYSSLFSHMTPAKLQEMSSLFSQTKYPGIPDPLAKSTLAANNMYLSPSLMKLQQEALNTMLMKPPKSSSSSSSSKIDTPPPVSKSPQQEKRSTPTKSSRDSPLSGGLKYPSGFSVADLAISSVPMPSDSPTRKASSNTSAEYTRKTMSTPTDFSRKSSDSQFYGSKERERSKDYGATTITPPIKKRMEFTIAELAGTIPTKMPKYSNDKEENFDDNDSGALNLSNN